MKIHDVQQGSSEWLALRAGIPTASQFDSIITRSGKRSESRERYKLTLLAERLMGHPVAEHITFWMQRGTETEAEAVSYYEFQRDLETERCGFITDDEGTYGASPDRFVGPHGLLEIKVPSEWVHMGYLLGSGKAYDRYIVQCQGQLLVCTDRDWVDIMSYHPELPPAIFRVERDAKYSAILAEAIMEFVAELDLAWTRIIDDGWGKPGSRKSTRSTQEELLQALKESLIEIGKDRAMQ
jgi:hypothetical protein